MEPEHDVSDHDVGKGDIIPGIGTFQESLTTSNQSEVSILNVNQSEASLPAIGPLIVGGSGLSEVRIGEKRGKALYPS